MPKTAVILGLLIASAMIPVAASATSDCSTAPPREETARYPLRGDTYILLDPEETTKMGFWKETNGVAGLQTERCVAHNETAYEADRFVGVALP